MSERNALEARLLERRGAGAKLLVPYITAGLGTDWRATLEAVAAAGADAVEVGIPFSDPMIDGPVIQEASVRALAAGATPQRILEQLRRADVGGVPLVVMTYYNLFSRTGHRRMASLLVEAGVSGVILPDLPVDEVGEWKAEAERAGLATVLLAAPTTPDRRLRLIAANASGFLYAVGLMGVTGERESLAASAIEIAARCKHVTELPVLVGVGISTPEQAVSVCRVADGAVVGSAVVRRMLDEKGPDWVADLVRSFRAGLDAMATGA